jgi:uncharacterized membrane protein YeaQ/YmgE (transglycosylase-associated protein family)
VELIPFIIAIAFQGLIVGALARLALPGRDPMSIPATIAVGMGGSLLAGIVVYLASDGRTLPGFFAAFCGAVLIMYFIRRSRGGGLTSPGAHDPRANRHSP